MNNNINQEIVNDGGMYTIIISTNEFVIIDLDV